MPDIGSTIKQILTFMVPFVFSLSCREAARAWMSDRLGDSTGRDLGRITLNPVPHTDLFGTILFPLLSILFPTGFFFGWGKPVPIDFHKFRNPKKGMLWVSLTGPMVNFIIAIVCAAVYRLIDYQYMLHSEQYIFNGVSLYSALMVALDAMITLNVFLGLFHFLPIPPLDGSRILAGLLPDKYSEKIMAMEPYGFFIFMFLLIMGIFRLIAIPALYIINFLKGGLI